MKYLCLVMILAGCGSSAEVESEVGVPIFAPRGIELPVKFVWGRDIPTQFRVAIQSAMNTWERAAGRTMFQHAGQDDRNGDDFPFHTSLDDDVVGIYVTHRWEDLGYNKEALASTVYAQDALFGDRILLADIFFNMNYSWGEALLVRDVNDIETVALHELGHLLGMGHRDSCSSVMKPSLALGEVQHELSWKDIDTVRAIYGDNS